MMSLTERDLRKGITLYLCWYISMSCLLLFSYSLFPVYHACFVFVVVAVSFKSGAMKNFALVLKPERNGDSYHFLTSCVWLQRRGFVLASGCLPDVYQCRFVEESYMLECLCCVLYVDVHKYISHSTPVVSNKYTSLACTMQPMRQSASTLTQHC